MARANYNILKETEDYVLIQDVGPWHSFITITNDAEGVLFDLKHMLNQRQLRYIDSEGELCALLYNDDYEFISFSILERKQHE